MFNEAPKPGLCAPYSPGAFREDDIIEISCKNVKSDWHRLCDSDHTANVCVIRAVAFNEREKGDCHLINQPEVPSYEDGAGAKNLIRRYILIGAYSGDVRSRRITAGRRLLSQCTSLC